MLGEAAEWGVDTHLNATAVDVLAWANYQRSGGKGAKPKPVRRPTSPDDEDD